MEGSKSEIFGRIQRTASESMCLWTFGNEWLSAPIASRFCLPALRGTPRMTVTTSLSRPPAAKVAAMASLKAIFAVTLHCAAALTSSIALISLFCLRTQTSESLVTGHFAASSRVAHDYLSDQYSSLVPQLLICSAGGYTISVAFNTPRALISRGNLRREF